MRFSEDGVSMFLTEHLFALKREQLKRDGRSLHITEPEAPMFDDLMQACCVVNIWTFCMHYLTTSLFCPCTIPLLSRSLRVILQISTRRTRRPWRHQASGSAPPPPQIASGRLCFLGRVCGLPDIHEIEDDVVAPA